MELIQTMRAEIMRLDDLTKEGIPHQVVSRWKERQGDSLLPVQRKLLRSGFLERMARQSSLGESCNLIVSAPTSSGKSFCAEMAAIRALASRQKAVMLFPLKSLAEEKYRQLSESYYDLGIKTIIVTSDHPENDRRFARGDYQLAIAIYEKFDLLLTANQSALTNIGLVVIDELQMIADSERGGMLERLLTRLMLSPVRPSLLALSAVLDQNAEQRLVEWLGAELIIEERRPVDLLKGVAGEGSVKYRSHNSHTDSCETFARPLDEDDPLSAIAGQIKESSGGAILFLKSRLDSQRMAIRLASSLNFPRAEKAIAELNQEEPSYLMRSLIQVLTHGVAFHNSDLTSRQRIIVEEAFRGGEIKALCSTTTLAMGVNLPVDTVYIEAVQYANTGQGGCPGLVPVSRAQFDNMAGRAGRLGVGEDRPGRAIVLAESEFDREVLWQTYVEPDSPETILPQVSAMPLEDSILHFVCSGAGKDIEFLKSALGRRLYKGDMGRFDAAFNKVVESGLLLLSTDRCLSLSPEGRAVAVSGLSVEEFCYYWSCLEKRHPNTMLGWLALVLSSPHWKMPPSMLTRAESSQSLPLKHFYMQSDFSPDELAHLIDPGQNRSSVSYRQLAGLKGCQLLIDWCQMVPAQRLEENYQLHLGQIVALGETAAHLFSSLAQILQSGREGESMAVKSLRENLFSLRYGLDSSMSELHSQFRTVLNRSDFLRLQSEGIESVAELSELSDERLVELLVSERKVSNVVELTLNIKEEHEMRGVMALNGFALGREPETLEIPGTLDKERYLVKINGLPVKLTGKSFKYFIKLAWSRLNKDAGWIFKEEIESGFNQARYLYRMKNEISSGFDSGWPIIENNRLGYYRLQIDPGKISIDAESLSKHPDWEVRSLFESSGLSGAIS